MCNAGSFWPSLRLEQDAERDYFIQKAGVMFLIIGIVLLVLWAGGFFVFHVSSFLIHILLIVAVISIIANFFSGSR